MKLPPLVICAATSAVRAASQAACFSDAACSDQVIPFIAGELISLGSFSPPLPPKPGLKVSVRYDGLAGSVQFK